VILRPLCHSTVAQRLCHAHAAVEAILKTHVLDLWLLLVRGWLAWQFLKSGWLKAAHWDVTLELFRSEYSVPLLPPELAAWMGTGGELIFPALLMLVSFGRWPALGLFAVNAMAVVSYPALWEFECPAAVQSHAYWAVLLLGIACTGVGRWSVSHLVGRND